MRRVGTTSFRPMRSPCCFRLWTTSTSTIAATKAARGSSPSARPRWQTARVARSPMNSRNFYSSQTLQHRAAIAAPRQRRIRRCSSAIPCSPTSCPRTSPWSGTRRRVATWSRRRSSRRQPHRRSARSAVARRSRDSKTTSRNSRRKYYKSIAKSMKSMM